jgi:glycosidase
MNFTENHDTVNDDYDFRMEKRCGWDNQTLGLAFCFAADGIPLIYNGQEIADARRHSIFGHSPQVTIDWANAETEDGRRRREMVRKLAFLRRTVPALTTPGQVWLDNDVSESVLSLRRGEGPQSVVFVGNFSPKPVSVRVDGVKADMGKNLVANGAKCDQDVFHLAPWGFVLMSQCTK